VLAKITFEEFFSSPWALVLLGFIIFSLWFAFRYGFPANNNQQRNQQEDSDASKEQPPSLTSKTPQSQGSPERGKSETN